VCAWFRCCAEFFPCLFAIGRTAGWLAHWNEFLDDPEKKIARPMQVYKGYKSRDYQPMDDRTDISQSIEQISPHVGIMSRL